MNANTNDKKSYIMLILSLFIVGTIGIFRRYIPLSSALLAFFRGLIGSVSLFAFIKLRKTGKWQRIEVKKLVGLIINGVFLGMNWILLFEAFNYTTIAKATLCYYMQPTIVLLISPLVFKEKLTVKKILCALVAFVGMIFISGVIGVDVVQAGELKGLLLGIGAACFYSLVVILNKKIANVDVYQKTIIQLISAAIILIPYLAITEDFKHIVFSANLVLLLLIVGIIHTGVVYALYFGSMSGLKAQTISTLSYIDPIVAMIVSALIFAERMSIWEIIGAVLIIGSAIVSELEPKLN